MKRYSVIAEREKGSYERVLKSENFDDQEEALKWAKSIYHAAYQVMDNSTRKVVASNGEFKLIKV